MNQNPGGGQQRSALAFTAMEPTLPAPTGAHEWCEGLPFIGTRALTIAERDELQVIDTAARGRSVGWGCVTFIAFLFTLGFTAFFEDKPLSFFGFLMLLGAPAYLLSVTLRVWGMSQRARLSLAANTVSLYDRVEPHDQSTQAGVRAEIHRALHPEEALTSVGVLSGGRTLWTVNGRRATSTTPFPGYAQPEPALRSSWPLLRRKPHPRRTTLSRATTTIEQRALSNRERDELYEMSEQWKPLWPIMALCGLTFGMLLAGMVQALLTATLASLAPSFYAAVVMTGWPFLRWVRLISRCLRLKRDYYRGTVDVEHCFYPPQGAAPQAWPPGTETIEVLPASGRIWTHDGQVASWRAFWNGV